MNKAAQHAKALYRKMSLREKLLTLLFMLVVLFLWANSWTERLSKWNDQRQFYKSELQIQQQMLERGPEFAAGLERALARVDPAKTYAAVQLSGRVDSLLRSARLSGRADIDSVRTREGEIFNDHNLRVRLNRVSLKQLINLNSLLKQDTPYINIQSVRIEANRRNPQQLDVRIEVNSFDLKEDSLKAD